MEDGQFRRREAWTAYWRSGRLHSCAGSYPGNYGGAIGAFWQAVFAALPSPARVLDLATGNGALPLMLWEQRGAGPGLEVDAVDLAEVSPRWHDPATHTALRFHCGVAMEALPFEPAAFDLVASQFGFEYASRDAALHELLRVLRPGGQVALVMHHAGSVIADVARSEQAHVARLLAADGLLARAAAVLPWFAQARAGRPPRGEPAAERDRAAYNEAMRSLARAAEASGAPDLLLETRDRVQRLLAGVGTSPDPALAELAGLAAELRTSALRGAELLQDALDRPAIDALAEALRAARPDTRLDIGELRQPEGLLAWSLWLRPDRA